jgi:hypothetical protein
MDAGHRFTERQRRCFKQTCTAAKPVRSYSQRPKGASLQLQSEPVQGGLGCKNLISSRVPERQWRLTLLVPAQIDGAHRLGTSRLAMPVTLWLIGMKPSGGSQAMASAAGATAVGLQGGRGMQEVNFA